MLLTRSPLEYPASRAFPFDLHVLSTPPAFILSQDQTLHKKRFRKKQAVKSPNPTKNKPNTQHPKQASSDWQNPKITKVQNQPPTRRGQKQRLAKNIRETCSTTPHAHHEPKTMTRLVIGIQPRHHRHTPKKASTTQCTKKAGKHTHATKVHWHTIEFSNNTSTPNTNPHK